MTMTPTSRLSAVANARLQQRKQRLSMNGPSTPSHAPADHEDKENGTSVSTAQGSQPSAQPINTLPTDDESTSTWSQGQSISNWSHAQSTVSGFTDDSFGFGSFPPMPSTITSCKLKKINTTILSPRQNSSNITFREVMSPKKAVYSPRTPKMSGATSFHSNSPKNLQIEELVQERDRLRLDNQLFKRKYEAALDEKASKIQDKDNEIDGLMKSIGNLTVLIDEADHSRLETLEEAEKQVENNRETIVELQQELAKTVSLLNKQRAAHELVKGTSSKESSILEQRLQTSTMRLENVQKRLEAELSLVNSEKEELKSKFDECMNELERIRNAEEKNRAVIESQITTIQTLKKELESARSKTDSHSKQREEKINEILEEKFAMESALRERIIELDTKIKSLTNALQSDKHNYDSILKATQEKLDSANRSHEALKTSMTQQIDDMKTGYEERIESLNKKAERLESELVLANQHSMNYRAELTDVKSEYVTLLEKSKHEKKEITTKLDKAMSDFEALKSGSERDIEILKSELVETYSSKLELEKQLKDAKRQLQNALCSLDEMALDGGKMRTDLEEIMGSYSTEKHSLNAENGMLKHLTEAQKNSIYHLNQELMRCDHSCEELRAQVKDLEERLWTETKQHGENSTGREMLLLENKYLKSMLEKSSSMSPRISLPPDDATSESRVLVDLLRKDKSQLEQQIESKLRLIDQLRASEKAKSTELSKAQQSIQMLKTKEKYLESRIDSLANQITRTVQEYETRLGEAREMGRR